MDKSIELLKQALARLEAMKSDFAQVSVKLKESAALLDKHLNGEVPKGPDLSKLSDREKQVFDLIGERWDGPEIAKKLGISIKTFMVHRDNIRAKLEVENHYELKALAEQFHNIANNNNF